MALERPAFIRSFRTMASSGRAPSVYHMTALIQENTGCTEYRMFSFLIFD